MHSLTYTPTDPSTQCLHINHQSFHDKDIEGLEVFMSINTGVGGQSCVSVGIKYTFLYEYTIELKIYSSLS